MKIPQNSVKSADRPACLRPSWLQQLPTSNCCLDPLCPSSTADLKLNYSHNSLPPMRPVNTSRMRTATESAVPSQWQCIKRGRWQCIQWYGPRNALTEPIRANLSQPVLTRKFEEMTQHPPLIHEDAIFSLDQSDDSDRENLPEFQTPYFPRSFESGKGVDPAVRNHLLATSPDFASGRVTPLEMQLHYGLERSLSNNAMPYPLSFDGQPPGSPVISGPVVLPPDRSTGNTGNSQIVAIDSKIEQAMDLVKTHLMFAVREEVDSLRNKILALETTIIQLEAENAILREHVPTEVLKNLANATNSPAPPTNNAVVAAQ
uniref:TSC22 domain family protein 3 n=1 Tax=Panagrolaimus sp. JU765 TaxID=591449 RepID=A0AC34QN21_9BILA